MLNFVVSLGDYQRREAYGENTLGYFCYWLRIYSSYVGNYISTWAKIVNKFAVIHWGRHTIGVWLLVWVWSVVWLFVSWCNDSLCTTAPYPLKENQEGREGGVEQLYIGYVVSDSVWLHDASLLHTQKVQLDIYPLVNHYAQLWLVDLSHW